MQVPCHYVVSTFDYFPYKDDFLLILREVKDVKHGDLHSMTLLALRYLTIDVLNTTNPFNYTSEEDIELQDIHLRYLKSL